MRIAVAGVRGVPANFGGSETAAEEIGRRLVERGHEVTVYCRAHNSRTNSAMYAGMRRVVLPSINTFNFDTISHSFLASLHLLATNTADVVHFHGMGNALLLPLFWFSRKRTVVTIDGPDWERPKWGRVAKMALRLSARLAARWADALIIDNHPAIAYFRRNFGVEGVYIPYGADPTLPTASPYLDELGLQRRRYLLFVGALVPDKGPDLLVDAYRRVETDMPLVVVGDSPFFPRFRQELRARADARVRFLGYVYGDRYRQLLANAYAYMHPLRSDGTSPALLQALAYGSCIVINSLPEALAAVGDAALPYRLNDPEDLARQIRRVIDDPELADELRRRARDKALREYNWDTIAAQHEELYAAVLQSSRRDAMARQSG
ncbi:MAG TPA: glycosyltransferase family 4 protein [Chloroflexota bacterium]|nr:glycosyltransferase family 4 protein [Chloroflexota bacterium]